MTFTGFTIAMFIIGAAGTAYGAYQQYQMASEAEDIANKNAKIEKERMERQVEVAEQAQARQLSVTKARIAASGLEEEGTPGFYMAELERLGDDEIMWMERESEWRQQQLKMAGEQASDQLKAGALSSLVGIFTGGAKFLQNYEQKRPTSQPVATTDYSEYGYNPYMRVA